MQTYIKKSKINNWLYVVLILMCFLNATISVNAQINSEEQIETCRTELLLEQLEYMNETREARNNLRLVNSDVTPVIPLAIHIIRSNDGTGGLSEGTLSEAIDNLNDAFFQKIKIGDNMKTQIFEFEACFINYIDDNQYSKSTLKFSSNRCELEYQMAEPNLINGYLNIFFLPKIDGKGWSSFPGYLKLNHPKDWIVMENSSATSPTLAHEIGHYFNLYHTFQDETDFGGVFIISSETPDSGCGEQIGDELCDTPPDPNISSCIEYVENVDGLKTCIYKESCDDSYKPDVHNIMSYTKPLCRTFFSPGQIERMQISLMEDRSYLLPKCEIQLPFTKIDFCRKRDYPALLALYNSTGGANWVNAWDLSDPEKPLDELMGVTLNTKGCVEKLELNSRNLNGSLPAEIGNLADLTNLILNNNKLTASIPKEIGYLRNLTNLELQKNNLSGSIPITIGMLTNLNYLVLNNNNLVGDIPEELSRLASLKSIPSLNNNKLSGCFDPNLSELCSKQNSSNNYISVGNNFTSTWEEFCDAQIGICSGFSRMSDSLTLVKLYNSLNGPNWAVELRWPLECPMDLWPGITLNELGRVKEISVSWRTFFEKHKGNMITEIGNLTYLEKLHFSKFQIYNALPPGIVKLKNLKYLDLSNVLETTMPKGLENLKNLDTLAIISAEVDEDGLFSKIGEIPSVIGKLKKLKSLNLSGFKGSLPKELATLPNLNSVLLCNNKLAGCFDPSFKSWCSIISNDTDEFCIDSNGNNNFNSTFEEFCNTGRGTCSEPCQAEIDLETQTLYGNQTHQSTQLTQSEGTFKSESEINLKSEEKISLFEGFKVESGGCLNATIEDCTE